MNGEMDELDEKEKERRKQDQIDYRVKQKTSNLFLLFGTIFEIALGFLIVLLLFLLVVFISYKVLKIPENAASIVFNVLLIVAFVGGLFLSFFIYKKLGRFVIKKYNLEPKLREDVLNQFRTTKEYKEHLEKKEKR